MKKSLLSCCLFLCASLVGFAQSNKAIIGVDNFSGTGTEASLNALRNDVMTSAFQTGRVQVIDLNDHTDGMYYNAFLRGQVDDVKSERTEIYGKDMKKHPGIQATVSFTLTLVDSQDGTTLRQEKFMCTGSADNQNEALMQAVRVSGSDRIKNFILNAFPLLGSIVAVDEADAKKVKTVYIDLGTNDGLSKGHKLEIYKVVDIAGETSRKQIGELKVEEVMGGARSLCKITKNGDVILLELNNGTPLVVESKEQKAGFFTF